LGIQRESKERRSKMSWFKSLFGKRSPISSDELRKLALVKDFRSLARALRSNNPEVRRNTVEFIALAGKIFPEKYDGKTYTFNIREQSDPQAVKLLTTALRDKDESVRTVAVQKLKEAHQPEAERALTEYYTREKSSRPAEKMTVIDSAEFAAQVAKALLTSRDSGESENIDLKKIETTCCLNKIVADQKSMTVDLKKIRCSSCGEITDVERSIRETGLFCPKCGVEWMHLLKNEREEPKVNDKDIKSWSEEKMLNELKKLCEISMDPVAYTPESGNLNSPGGVTMPIKAFQFILYKSIAEDIGNELNRRGGYQAMKNIWDRLGDIAGKKALATEWNNIEAWREHYNREVPPKEDDKDIKNWSDEKMLNELKKLCELSMDPVSYTPESGNLNSPGGVTMPIKAFQFILYKSIAEDIGNELNRRGGYQAMENIWDRLGDIAGKQSLELEWNSIEAWRVHHNFKDSSERTADTRTLESLVASLKTPITKIQWEAAAALGNLGDVRAVEPLIEALKIQDTGVRCYVVDALGKLGDYRAVEPLIEVLNNYEYAFESKRAAEALGQIGDMRAVDSLIAALGAQNYSGISIAAAEALGKLGDRKAVEPLTALLKHNDEDVCNAASDALRKLSEIEVVEPVIHHKLCLALYVFDSDKISSDVSLGYGGYAQSELLGALAKALVPEGGWVALSGLVLACHGDLTSRSFLGEKPSTKVLGNWLQSSTHDIDSSQLDQQLVYSLRNYQVVGYIPYVIGLGPLPELYALNANQLLKEFRVIGYKGLFTLQGDYPIANLDTELYLPLHMEICGSKCRGWSVSDEVLREIGLER
jgi:HEAT repeat protein